MPRLIYSLELDLGRQPDGGWLQLIAPLDASGQSPHCRAVPPKRRVIDLRVGDRVEHGGRNYRIEAVRAYREATRFKAPPSREGYVVKGS